MLKAGMQRTFFILDSFQKQNQTERARLIFYSTNEEVREKERKPPFQLTIYLLLQEPKRYSLQKRARANSAQKGRKERATARRTYIQRKEFAFLAVRPPPGLRSDSDTVTVQTVSASDSEAIARLCADSFYSGNAQQVSAQAATPRQCRRHGSQPGPESRADSESDCSRFNVHDLIVDHRGSNNASVQHEPVKLLSRVKFLSRLSCGSSFFHRALFSRFFGASPENV